ncbi:CPBP family intramembrane glutamic endopeptidase [Nocardia sp. NPDC004573]
MKVSSRSHVIGAACAAVYVAAVTALLLTGHTAVRTSADNHDTRTLLAVWLPVVAGLLLARAIPPPAETEDPFAAGPPARVTRQAWLLAALAVVFAVVVHVTPGEGWFVLWKLTLLVLPLLARWATVREWARVPTRGRWLRPLPAVFAFLVVTALLQPWTGGPVPDPVVLVVVFLVNAVIEEIFYRFWLQTRLESRYGRWPAIALAALLWASWHTAIQGGLGLPLDLASVIVNQGVTGLFLGYLWSRHRNPWLVIGVHGLMNAPLTMFAAALPG